MAEDFPFLKANDALAEASRWLTCLLLPETHGSRQESDADCFDEAIDQIDRASSVLEEGSFELVIDAQAAVASDQLSRLAKGNSDLRTGGTRPYVTEASIAGIRDFLSDRWADRLSDERLDRQAMEDASPD